jgi:hypothetical protein
MVVVDEKVSNALVGCSEGATLPSLISKRDVAWDGRAWLLLGTSAPNIIGKLEHLGGLAFTSDDAAIEFGREVVQDLIEMYSAQYSGGVLVITNSGRAVGDVAVP